jgi:hypothetical protein
MSTISVKLTVHPRCHRETPSTHAEDLTVTFAGEVPDSLGVSLARVGVHQYESACNVVKKAVRFNYVPPTISWIGF